MPIEDVNGHKVDVLVLGKDNETLEGGLESSEAAVVLRADRLIRDNQLGPDATLERVESNRGLQDDDHGRYYLRYRDADGNAHEYRSRSGQRDDVDPEGGIITLAQR